jgi:hypothetical protein
MAIPESQLITWSGQGSVAQSSTTYNTVKSALESPASIYAGKGFEVFLQGSYGNNTNTYADSDVDIVIRLNETFSYDISSLSETQQAAFRGEYPAAASYPESAFKRDVLSLLEQKYGTSVTIGNKSIKISANGSRRNADVVAAVTHRNYYQNSGRVAYIEGISFTSGDGTQIFNYPKLHSSNCTAKHQATSQRFKPAVRIFKNLRSRLIDEQMVAKGDAPSYFIEGLLYNVPDRMFSSAYNSTIVDCLNWVLEADRAKFHCANEQYYLLHDSSPVSWKASKCDEFLSAACTLWNNW